MTAKNIATKLNALASEACPHLVALTEYIKAAMATAAMDYADTNNPNRLQEYKDLKHELLWVEGVAVAFGNSKMLTTETRMTLSRGFSVVKPPLQPQAFVPAPQVVGANAEVGILSGPFTSPPVTQ